MVSLTRGAGLVLAVGVVAAAQAPPDYTGNCTDTACHGGFAKRPVVHGPVSEGGCDACHEASEGAGHRFALTAEIGELCLDCHEEVTEDRAQLHGPVAAGECTACHDPHASDRKALLLEAQPALCLDCHESLGERLEDLPNTHAPATEACTTCHDPHGANVRQMLNALPPGLCFDCHDDIEEFADDATVSHGALTTGDSCVACHDPHASQRDRLLSGEPMALCLSCHDKPLESDGGMLENLAQRIKDNPSPHGPVGDGDCLACHLPHGGENFRMLTEAYPARFYAPFEEEKYALCFSCHDAEMVEDERTEDLTGFRNGDRNLHYLHVNRAVKGRTCRACHEVHASRQPKHIRDAVPFGKWEIPLRYEQTSTGGSCQPGCHKSYRYDRDKAVANLPG